MANKRFSERLNHELDSIGIPQRINERIMIFSKLLKISPYKAENILNGNTFIANPYLKDLANELEVKEEWLLGTSNEKHSN